MKLLKKILVVFLTVIGSILFIYSCGKKDREANELSTIASDDNDADNSFADLKNAGDQAGIKNSTKGYDKSKDTCFKVKVVSYDSINYKLNLVVDFGQNDCSCNDAKLRRGKINIEYNGEIGLVGSNVIYTPENYYVNGYGVNGIKTLKVIEPYTYSVKIENGQITKPDGTKIYWTSDRVRKMIAGFDTPQNVLDDSYEITGTSEGINSSGKTVSFTTLTPLLKSVGCQWIKSGKLSIKREGKKDAILDYGDGSCDDKATLSVGSWNKTINAKKW